MSILLSLLFIVYSAYSSELQLYSASTQKYESVTVVDYQGVKISKSCLKDGKPKCQAWNAVGRGVASIGGGPLLGNPAAKYCGSHKAQNKILKDKMTKEYDYCVFPDGSMIDAWSLYNKHHK